MDIVGKIIQVLPEQSGTSKTGNPWKVQSYVLETQEQYPRKVCFEIFGEDRIKNNPCKIDDVVTVSFDIESREFSGRWYTSIRACAYSKVLSLRLRKAAHRWLRLFLHPLLLQPLRRRIRLLLMPLLAATRVAISRSNMILVKGCLVILAAFSFFLCGNSFCPP